MYRHKKYKYDFLGAYSIIYHIVLCPDLIELKTAVVSEDQDLHLGLEVTTSIGFKVIPSVGFQIILHGLMDG